MEAPRQDSLRDLLVQITSEAGRSSAEGRRSTAEEELWRRLSRRLLSYARLSMGPHSRRRPSDVEDLVQWLLLRLQDGRFSQLVLASDNVTAYLLRVLRNRVLELDRLKTAELDILALEKSEARPSSEAPWVEEEGLPGYLRRLSTEERELLALRFWDNLSVREVAVQLGLSYSATAVRYFRLFHRLRQELAEPD